jgi:hypothetical protein
MRYAKGTFMQRAAGGTQYQGSADYIRRLNALDMRTYFIGNKKQGVVKIGRSVDVVSRRSALQTAYPFLLSILRVEKGDKEDFYHALWATHRLEGEWFSLAPEIQAWIDSPMESR